MASESRLPKTINLLIPPLNTFPIHYHITLNYFQLPFFLLHIAHPPAESSDTTFHPASKYRHYQPLKPADVCYRTAVQTFLHLLVFFVYFYDVAVLRYTCLRNLRLSIDASHLKPRVAASGVQGKRALLRGVDD